MSGDEIEDGWFAASQIQTKGSRETSRSVFEDLDRFRIENSSSAAGVVQQPVRDECLNINMFSSLVQVRVVISDWKAGYNHRWRRSALGYQAPAVYAAVRIHP